MTTIAMIIIPDYDTIRKFNLSYSFSQDDMSSVDTNNKTNVDSAPIAIPAHMSTVSSTLPPLSPTATSTDEDIIFDLDGSMNCEIDPGDQWQKEECVSNSESAETKRRLSMSSTRSDTDEMTKMMFDLWGSKKQIENIPTAEISSELNKNVEKIVAKELYEMNRAEREAIVEELHGVKSRAVPETPELIRKSLEEFRKETVLLCKSKRTDTDVNGKKHPIGKAHLRAVEILDSNYVIAPEFRIRFLRTEFFDLKKAVLRYCRYLNHLWDLFGDVSLVRQIALRDLNKKELKYLKGGQVQGLLSRDKMGRRIYALFGLYDVPIQERTRVEAYLSFAVIADDETTQINGATLVTFFSFNEKSVIKYDRSEQHIIKKMVTCTPIRYSAMHFCMPDEPVYYFLKTVVHSLIQPEMRATTRFHTGSHMECNYALCQFGIPVDDIPKSVTGTIKSKSIQKFMKSRMAIEDYQMERCRLLGVRYVTKAMEDELVATAASYSPPSEESLERWRFLEGFPPSCPGTDCPEVDCIVFGDRVTYKHPPNVKFRDYLRGKRHQQEERKEQERQQHGKERRRKERIFSAEFLDEIIDEASEIFGYKFVSYDKDAGWYAYIKPNTQENRQELRKKISQLMRDERKRERAYMTLSGGLTLEAVAEAVKNSGVDPSGNRATYNNNDVINSCGTDSDGTDDMNIGASYFSSSSKMGLDAKRMKKDPSRDDGDTRWGGCIPDLPTSYSR